MKTTLAALLLAIPTLASAEQLPFANEVHGAVPADAILCGFQSGQVVCWAEPDAVPLRAYACQGAHEDLHCSETEASTFRPLFAFCETRPDADFLSECS